MSYGLRFETALQRIDGENGKDPHFIQVDGALIPSELLYSQWVSDWVLRLCPQATEALQLAARSQHICRWMIPRKSYEMTRAGYLKWRADLKQFHAKKSGEILADAGYPEEFITRVQALNLKANLAGDPECQTLEDALCLVTIQHQLAGLMEKTDSGKMLEIVRKTWKKMSPEARNHALALPLPEEEKRLIQTALTEGV
jgi:hypothetical protein